MEQIRKKLEEHDRRFDAIDKHFEEMSEQLDTVAGQVQKNAFGIAALGRQVEKNTSAIEGLERTMETKIEKSTERILTALDRHESSHRDIESEQVHKGRQYLGMTKTSMRLNTRWELHNGLEV